jgi:lipopolysaccharide export system permease protein
VRIIDRYVLKEHVGPFTFALSALTSLLLLQYMARRFGDLVGKGLSWQIITEFILLSVPLTVALTLPMAVLVAVLYAFSRLASENEITAMRAGGISSRSLVRTPLVFAVLLSFVMLWFNDQVLSRANHRLATLQIDIIRTKPTFALKPQILNTVKESQLYLRAAQIDEETQSMRDVTIYDLSDPTRRRSIYGERGTLKLASNQRDLMMYLYNGVMVSEPNDKPGQLSLLYYKTDQLRVRDVANQFEQSNADTTSKGEREMSVCEMQTRYDIAMRQYEQARRDRDRIRDELKAGGPKPITAPLPASTVVPPVSAGGIGEKYCALLKRIRAKLAPRTLHAAELPHALPVQAAATPRPPQQPQSLELNDANMRLDEASHRRNRYAVEIEKKFSLAAACIVFVLVGAPIAVRFPRGGVGVVIGVSFLVFAVYYVALIGGEELANRGYVAPFWAMWGANVLFLLAGIALMSRMGYESATPRGAGIRERFDATRLWFARRLGLRMGLAE